ncbi:MAG TPA: VCBS repeat-containing protein, partial [Solirubrobacterales bacterium]|nr:VCBS repeat-containing protein [Solirubrobacterales bacterium]
MISSQHYYGNEPDWEAVQRSGASTYRMEFSMGAFAGGASWAETYDLHVEKAAKRGITILAYLNGGEQGRQFPLSTQWSGWLNNFVWQAVTRYGENGKFWVDHPSLPYHPITAWEVWNEPNLPENNPGGTKVQPRAYGELLEAASSYIHGAANVRQPVNNAKVIFGGLWQKDGASGVSKYIQEATGESSLSNYYQGLSIHPYSFAGSQTEKIQGMKNAVNAARNALNIYGGAGKTLWITELGWPVGGTGQVTVDEAEQASLLTSSFNWLKAESGTLNLQLITWYLYRDPPEGVKWDAFCGLRDAAGGYRPSWWAFQAQTGASAWPPPAVQTGAASEVQENQATLNGTISPNSKSVSYHFEYGMTGDYGRSAPIPDGNVAAGVSAVGVSVSISNLLAGTTYHYRIVASGVGGTSYGEDRSFKTVGTRVMSGPSNGWGITSWSTILSSGPPAVESIGDFNGDGKADMVSVEPEGGNTFRYMVGSNSGGTVSSWTKVLSGMSKPVAMDLGDFNADGKTDIISAESEGGGLYRYMVGFSTGSGISSWVKVKSGMSYPEKMGIGDFDSDGKADIFALESEGGGLYRYMVGFSNGWGISSWTQVKSGMTRPTQMDLGDFDADGKTDIVAAEPEGGGLYRYMVGFSNGWGISSWTKVKSGMSYPEKMGIADFDADGKADIGALEAESNGSYRYMVGISNGWGIATWTKLLGGMVYPQAMDLGDFDADGKADMVAAEAEGGGLYRYMVGISTGSGISKWLKVKSGMSFPEKVNAGDFNADGKADIVALESEGGGLYRYMVGISTGSGISSWTKVLSGMSKPVAMDLGDFNADGKTDIISAESEGGGLYRYMVGFSTGSGISSWVK